MTDDKRIIFILGMHRSGTSAATRLLNLLGVWLGKNLISGMQGVNDAGFWEHKDIVNVHEDILAHLDSAWFDGRSLPSVWWEKPEMMSRQDTIKKILNDDFRHQPVIGVKDPRLCRLFPLWLPIVKELIFVPQCLIVIRHPLEVVASLTKRDGLDHNTGLFLWLIHVLEAEFHSREQTRTLVDFNEILTNWRVAGTRIARDFNMTWPASVDTISQQADTEISSDLRHHVIEPATLCQKKELECLTLEIYEKLKTQPLDSLHVYLDACRSQVQKNDFLGDALNNALFNTNRLLTRKTKELITKGDNHHYAITIVQQRDAQLKEINFNFKKLGEEHACAVDIINERDKQIALLKTQLIALTKAHDESLEVMKTKDRQLKTSKIFFKGRAGTYFGILKSIMQHADPMNLSGPYGIRLQRLYDLFNTRTIDIIIPVFRGYEEVKVCLESVLKYPQENNFNIIVINDASPDDNINEFLSTLSALHKKITVIQNPTNLGFVATVNIGMALHRDNDVLLLNSDTIVSGNWLDRLRNCAYRSCKIGTVTPFSNNATICSFPIFCKDNPLVSRWPLDALDRVFAKVNRDASIDIPTAVGFCMYIKRTCINDVGMFDVENFGHGYGEENDFCMRAFKKGWRHALGADTFVYHAGGVSFSTEKEQRITAAMETMDRLHFEYHRCVHQHITQNPASYLRLNAMIHLIKTSSRPKILFICHNLGGGTENHIQEVASFLENDMDVIVIRPGTGGRTILSPGTEIEAESLYFFLPDEYPEMIKMCRFLGIHRVHFHHTLGLSKSLWGLPGDLGVAFDITLHDYYFINANPKLIGRDKQFSELRATRDARCGENEPIPGGISPVEWRHSQALLLKNADRIFAPSQYMAELIQSYFEYTRPIVAFHPDWEKDMPYPDVKPVPLKSGEPLKILVLGALSKEKGADILESCAQIAQQENYPLSFHLIGYAYRPMDPAVVQHGVYKNEHLDQLICDLAPHLIWYPARWPETYSYTLSAGLRTAKLILGPDIGSFSERLEGRPWTWIVPWDQSPGQFLTLFLSIQETMTKAPTIDHPRAWHPQPHEETQSFYYKTDYLVTTDRSSEDKTIEIDMNWMKHFCNPKAPMERTGPIRAEYTFIFDLLGKIKAGRLGACIMDCIPLAIKHKIKKYLLQAG